MVALAEAARTSADAAIAPASRADSRPDRQHPSCIVCAGGRNTTPVSRILSIAVVAVLAGASGALAQSPALADGQRMFYSGQYEGAAAAALAVRTADPGNLAASELRASALLFQIRRQLGEFSNNEAKQDDAWRRCAACPDLMSAFVSETTFGKAQARARLEADPLDETALFFLGKLDLNYIWLQLGTLGRKTGWSEYWEARKSLDTVLERNPEHVRARVARAWIDYIVDTKLPRGTKWLLGGGNKKRGLLAVREAARTEADFFVQVEAAFSLWDMQVRERNLVDAVATARLLSRDFPDNQELARFIERHDATARR